MCMYIYIYITLHIYICIYIYTYIHVYMHRSKQVGEKKDPSHNSHQQGFEASAPKRSPPWPMRIWSSRCEDDKRSDLISASWGFANPCPIVGPK